MKKKSLLNPDMQARVLDLLKIQKEIFHYDRLALIQISEDLHSRVLLDTDKKNQKKFRLKSKENFKQGEIIQKNALDPASDIYQFCKFFNFDVLAPVFFNDRCVALMAIHSQIPVFTDRQTEMVQFSAYYISNLINSENLVRDLEDYSERMQKMLDEMITLHEITHALESTDNLDTLLEYIMRKSQNVMQAEASSLMLVIEETNELEFKVALGPKATAVKPFRLPIGKGISGWVAESGEAVLIPDAYSDPRFDPSFDKRSGFKTRSMLCVPMIHKSKIVGIMTLLNKMDGTPFNESDQILFTIFATQAALSIENARLLFAAIEKERLDKELQVASEIQNLLIPQSLPKSTYLEIAAEYIPCKEVGGDFYDVIQLDENRHIFVVADVSGKGIPGALVVSNMQATLRAFLQYSDDLLPIVTRLNESITRQTTADRYITFFIGLYDHQKSSLTYINAGHNPPLLVHRNGQMKELKTGGIFIGFMPWEYESETVPFRKGEQLILYTDGLVEAMNKKEIEFDMTGLKSTVRENMNISSDALKNEIIKRVHKHTGNMPLADDFTLLITRRLK
jgi:sigma-B regulation protein RsbU (phosphoserine phosphatase)